MKAFKLSLFADYFQFYMQDEDAKGDLSQSWDNEAVRRLLAIAPGIIGVRTARNTYVPVAVEIHEAEPDDDSSGWDQVIEAPLHVASSRIVFAGCTDYFPDALRIEVPPDTYRARVSYGALNIVSTIGRREDDHYRVQLWAASSIDIRTLKRRSERTSRPLNSPY